MTKRDRVADVLTSHPPPEAQRALWLYAYVSLGAAWVLMVAVSILVLATGGRPAGILFLVGLGVFFTVVLVLFRRPPLVRQRQRTSS